MTALERTIIALLVLAPHELTEASLSSAGPLLGGELAEKIALLRSQAQAPNGSWTAFWLSEGIDKEFESLRRLPAEERHRLLLLNLGYWLHNHAAACQILSESLDTEARGSASDCVEQMRRSKYRRGAAKAVE